MKERHFLFINIFECNVMGHFFGVHNENYTKIIIFIKFSQWLLIYLSEINSQAELVGSWANNLTFYKNVKKLCNYWRYATIKIKLKVQFFLAVMRSGWVECLKKNPYVIFRNYIKVPSCLKNWRLSGHVALS